MVRPMSMRLSGPRTSADIVPIMGAAKTGAEKARRIVTRIARRMPKCSTGLQPVPRRVARSRNLLQEFGDAIDALVDLLHARREAETNVIVESAVIAGHDRDVV